MTISFDNRLAADIVIASVTRAIEKALQPPTEEEKEKKRQQEEAQKREAEEARQKQQREAAEKTLQFQQREQILAGACFSHEPDLKVEAWKSPAAEIIRNDLGTLGYNPSALVSEAIMVDRMYGSAAGGRRAYELVMKYMGMDRNALVAAWAVDQLEWVYTQLPEEGPENRRTAADVFALFDPLKKNNKA